MCLALLLSRLAEAAHAELTDELVICDSELVIATPQPQKETFTSFCELVIATSQTDMKNKRTQMQKKNNFGYLTVSQYTRYRVRRCKESTARCRRQPT